MTSHSEYTTVGSAYKISKYFFDNHGMIPWSRFKFHKHKLPGLLEHFDADPIEARNMKIKGYHRIWDCGNAV